MMRLSSLSIPLFVAQLSLLGGCATSGDVCDEVCPLAQQTYEACQESFGFPPYGTPTTYESAEDYENWCSTWILERRLLAEHSATEASEGGTESSADALLERCEEQRNILSSGDCTTYFQALED